MYEGTPFVDRQPTKREADEALALLAAQYHENVHGPLPEVASRYETAYHYLPRRSDGERLVLQSRIAQKLPLNTLGVERP